MNLEWWQWVTGTIEFAVAGYLTDWILTGRIRHRQARREAHAANQLAAIKHQKANPPEWVRAAQRAEEQRQQFRRTPQPTPTATIIHDRRRVNDHLQNPHLVSDQLAYLRWHGGARFDQDFPEDTLNQALTNAFATPDAQLGEYTTIQQWGGGTVRVRRTPDTLHPTTDPTNGLR